MGANNLVRSQSEATKGGANSVWSFQLFDLWIMKAVILS